MQCQRAYRRAPQLNRNVSRSLGAALVLRTHLWGVADDSFVGNISIRHGLNEALRVERGQIGYDTVSGPDPIRWTG